MKRLFAAFVIAALMAGAARADTPPMQLDPACIGDVSVGTTPITIAINNRYSQVIFAAATVPVYQNQQGTAVAGSGHAISVGAVEVFTVTGFTLSLVAKSAGTINVCWGTGN